MEDFEVTVLDVENKLMMEVRERPQALLLVMSDSQGDRADSHCGQQTQHQPVSTNQDCLFTSLILPLALTTVDGVGESAEC